jgi:hypothetical protein
MRIRTPAKPPSATSAGHVCAERRAASLLTQTGSGHRASRARWTTVDDWRPYQVRHRPSRGGRPDGESRRVWVRLATAPSAVGIVLPKETDVDQFRERLKDDNRTKDELQGVSVINMTVYRAPAIVDGRQWEPRKRRELVEDKDIQRVIKKCERLDAEYIFESNDVLLVDYPPPPGWFL